MLKDYELRKTQLLKQLNNDAAQRPIIKKKAVSNLFRYIHKPLPAKKGILIQNFDNILSIDRANEWLEVEGLTTYEKIVDFTLLHGFLPTVAPELKHITIGGAIVGIGIESSSFRFGFVHDGLLEAEVLLPNGNIVLCKPDNEFADLFFALPNSYGTLGYILRAKIKIYPAKPYVKINSNRFNDLAIFLEKMHQSTTELDLQFIEGLVFKRDELYLLTAKFVDDVSEKDDIYRENIFYKLIQEKQEIYLTTKDYIFRYDPDWFWNIPETGFYNLFRKWAPITWRNSGFYKKYMDLKKKIFWFLGATSSVNQKEESLIQDWEVLWEKGHLLLDFALNQIDLLGKPWVVVPILPKQPATLYPLQKNQLYFNLGCYCSSKRSDDAEPFYNTKIMDDYCFKLDGLKMLYSSTLLDREKFFNLYNGKKYYELKQKYDPNFRAGDLYQKVSMLINIHNFNKTV